MTLRQRLIEAGAHIALALPARAGLARWRRPTGVISRRASRARATTNCVKDADAPFEDEKFSYLVALRDPQRRAARARSSLRRASANGEFRAEVCAQLGNSRRQPSPSAIRLFTRRSANLPGATASTSRPGKRTMTRPRVAPYLTVTPAAAAIGFYTAAFGAKQRALMPSVDGLRIAHCELLINGGSVMLADVFPEFGQTRAPMPGEQVTVSDQPRIRHAEGSRRHLRPSDRARRQDRDAADQFLLGHALRHPARPVRPSLDFQRAAAEVNPITSRAAPRRCDPNACRRSRSVFQAEAERAVEANMREMDERELRQQRLPEQQPEGAEKKRRERRMRAIIGRGADARPREIEDDAKVGRKEQQSEKPQPPPARA